MKKIIISLIAIGASIGMTASPPGAGQLETANGQKSIPQKMMKKHLQGPVVTRDGDNYWFGYCAGISNFLQMPVGYTGTFVMEAAIGIPAEFSTNWKGNKITQVDIGFGETPSMKAMVYITKDLYGEPEYMEEFDMADTYNWNQVTLSTPYEIDGEQFYVGYQVETPAGYPVLGVDLIPSPLGLGDFFGVFQGEDGGYENMGDSAGNVSLRFCMEGSIQPDFYGITGYLFTPELVGINDKEPMELDFTLQNVGATSIADVEMDVTVGGEPLKDMEVILYGSNDDNLIPFGELGLVSVYGYPQVTGDDLPVVINITALKGPDGSSFPTTKELTGEVDVAEYTFTKNILVEEFTGTWCGWCPRGIVGMEYMRKNYSDKGFIGIAVHNDDAMALENYQPIATEFNQGYPSAVMDRDPYYAIATPNAENLAYYFESLIGYPTTAQVDLTAMYDSERKAIDVTATTEFIFSDNDAEYALAFVLTQDHVGPYNQTNYFAGTDSGEAGMEEWEAAPAKASVYFDEVARLITDPYGISGSIPSKIEAFTQYEYKTSLDISELAKIGRGKPNYLNLNNCHIVAMLLDTDSGEVVNSAIINMSEQAGVDSLVDDQEDGVYKAYNLQGVKVAETQDASVISSLPKGIYIVNGKKVLVK